MSSIGQTIEANTFYSLRVEAHDEGSTTRFRCFVDDLPVIDVTDSTYSGGRVMFGAGPDETTQYQEIEVLPIPGETETIEINS